MAQHDYVIANQSGASFRADLNNALAAIVSNNSGATAPSTTYAYQWWPDTTAGQLKLRNGSNDGWIVIRELDGTMLMEDGTAASPGLAFASDLDTGFFRAGTNQLGIATNGTVRLTATTTAITSALPVDVLLGSASTPSYTFTGDLNTGIYSPGADQIAIATGGTGRLFVDSSGRLGVGTTAPSQLLEIKGANARFAVNSTTVADGGILLQGNGTTYAEIKLDASSGILDIAEKQAAGNITFSTGTAPTERARIDSSGRLLVGTSSARAGFFNGTAGTRLQIENAGAGVAEASFVRDENNTNGGLIIIGKSRGTTAGANTVVQSGDEIGTVDFQAADGTDFVIGARITAAVDGTPGADDMPGRLVFSTTADGASSPSERMRLDSSGNLQINSTDSSASAKLVVRGTTSNSVAYFSATNVTAASNGLYAYITCTSAHPTNTVTYAVNGQVSAVSGRPMGGVVGIEQNNQYGILGYYSGSASWGGYFNGSVYASGTYQGSDARLKNVIEEIEPIGVLNKLDSIRSIKYTWKENSTQYVTGQTKTEIGFLAQEVQEHFPEVVTEVDCSVCITEQEKDSLNHELGITYGVDYAKMVPVLLAALKEAKARIETLEAKVTALENG